MNKKLTASDYSSRGLKAVMQVLVELGQIMGAHENSFVIVGGLVPGLLFQNAEPEHVGTLDIDIELNPDYLGKDHYAEFVDILEQNHYQRNLPHLRPFQMQKIIDLVDGGKPFPVILDLLRPKNSEVKKNRPPLKESLRIQEIDGGQFALRYYEQIKIDGKMPDGRNNQVKILVASVPAFLVMKGYALVGRDKQKDAYDIWFCISNYKDGFEQLAKDCKPLLDDPEAKKAFCSISEKFRNENDFGPITIRQFLENSFDKWGNMTLDQIQVDAYFRVKKFCELLGIA